MFQLNWKSLAAYVGGCVLVGLKSQLPPEMQPAVDYVALFVFGINLQTSPLLKRK